MSLDKLREKQRKIDEKIVELLDKRLQLSEKIGNFKLKNGLKVENKSLEKKKIQHLFESHPAKHLNKGFLDKVWKLIFARSKEIQQGLEIDLKDKK